LGSGSLAADSDQVKYWDCTPADNLCGYGKQFGLSVNCDFTKNQCQPSCRIGGCFCTENRQCDSHICYKFHCKSIGFSPAWTLTISAFIVLVIVALCCLWHRCIKREYVIAHAVPHLATAHIGAGILNEKNQ